MRNIINLSLPEELSFSVDKLIRKGKYATKSEFFRELIRERIAEDDLLSRVEKSRQEIRAGKGKVLKSLKDLR